MKHTCIPSPPAACITHHAPCNTHHATCSTQTCKIHHATWTSRLTCEADLLPVNHGLRDTHMPPADVGPGLSTDQTSLGTVLCVNCTLFVCLFVRACPWHTHLHTLRSPISASVCSTSCASSACSATAVGCTALPCIAKMRRQGTAVQTHHRWGKVPRSTLEYLRTINGVDRLERERRIAIDFEEGRCARAVEHHVEADDVETR